MGTVFQMAIQFEVLACGECGIEFAAPEWWVRRRKEGAEGKRDFYCPNGHPRVFVGETEAAKYKRLYEQEQAAKIRMQESRDAAYKRERNAEIQAKRERTRRTKLEQRARGGVCPCCNRSFTALARHMATKHPDFGHGVHEAPKA
jgi:NMD protein affecting ribosome stability and mRNA decay